MDETVTYADKSGTITTGGVSQQISASSHSRRGFLIQNISSGDLWLNTDGEAGTTPGNFWLTPGAVFELPRTGVSTNAISIYGATTGQAFTAREW